METNVRSVIGAVIFAAFILGCMVGASRKSQDEEKNTDYGDTEQNRPAKIDNVTHWRQYIYCYFAISIPILPNVNANITRTDTTAIQI
jgi:hypothetical protein